MRRLPIGYAVSFNRRHKRHGRLFQNRYKSIICQEDAYLQESVRCIHLNPLRAKMVEDVDGLNHYPFSGQCLLSGAGQCDFQDPDEIFKKGRRRPLADARGLFIHWCSSEPGLSLTELAHQLEMTVSGAGYASRRGEALARHDRYRLTG